MLAYDPIAFYPWDESQPIPNENGVPVQPYVDELYVPPTVFQLLMDRHRSHGQADE